MTDTKNKNQVEVIAVKQTIESSEVVVERTELTQEIAGVIEEIVEESENKPPKKGVLVTVIDEEQIMLGDHPYKIVKNHRDAFDAERLGERYSDVLSRYDYIVADWGFEQLRLKGFFYESNRKVPAEMRIDTLEDYLYEFCNFGCPYFVIERTGIRKEKQQNRNKRKKATKNPQAHIAEKKVLVEKPKKPQQPRKKAPIVKTKNDRQDAVVPKQKSVVGKQQAESKGNSESSRHFTIRKKEK